MAAHHGVGVVEVEGVPRCPVDECGGEPRGALAAADQRRRSAVFGPRHGLEEDAGQGLARPGERAAEGVEQAVAGRLERVGGYLLVADATYGAYERQRRAGAHRARLHRIVAQGGVGHLADGVYPGCPLGSTHEFVLRTPTRWRTSTSTPSRSSRRATPSRT